MSPKRQEILQMLAERRKNLLMLLLERWRKKP
jgi:hypothetical protein